ncbi:MAG: cytochrome b/b6 domain-containing protein [Bradyrhizobiaceae bacterium]|nr:cytochrome b/b6 domain-containing protein [Bradyrhizobiaceae bacterium]
MKLAPTTEIPVWDPYVRLSHWLLAAAVLTDWVTDEPRWMHVWLGYLATALVILRVLWGFVGPEHARFMNFVTGPRQTFSYLFALLRFSSKRYVGHSPAGGAMIVALLVMVGITSVTGMVNLAQDEGRGPFATIVAKVERPARVPGQRRPPLLSKQVHETVANITLALVVLHLCGVALASFVHKENLVRAMITGRKGAET